MHILAERVVRAAIAAGAVIDPIGHFDLLADLDRAARATSAPPLCDRLALLDRPVIVGGAVLRRLSIAGRAWLNECADVWWSADPERLNLAIAWVLANGRCRAALDFNGDEPSARATISTWSKVLTCTPEQLATAATAVLAPLETPNPLTELPVTAATAPMALGSTLTRVVRELGGTFDFWLVEVSEDVLNVAIDAIARSDEAEAKAAKAAPEDWMPAIRAFKQWTAARTAFSARIRETPA